MTVKEKIDKAYLDIQNLQIQPTRHNTMLLADAMLMLEYAVKDVLNMKPEKMKDEEDGSELSES